ncbi:uncharacterized protein LOC115446690 [Manduca sexta]|uniref:uncharacterized protein LOC115446690 n=1 Tax=Manduca sexta TaxID=7130 RepID=UPI0011834F49|nr:uncharacterized protein LOC115446690 [Manduca sexta]XP_037293029.1 uncharacterized protein LOC115446690 [Manduca sexta]XP_037293030.1 uncharacterized protein LOC115446690 [Manduca sexta]
MVVRVGINGFGRIGRVIFRTCLQNNDIELSAINDPAITAEYICYLIKFDSTHGKFNKSVNYADDEIIVEDRTVKIFHEKMPSSVPWQTAGVQYVIEASGMFTTLEKASGHMKSEGVRRVIVTAPSVDVPMIILGVNDFTVRPDQKVLSCASSTLYCLAPIIKVLEDHFGVSEGFVTSIHAMTPSLKPLDGLCLRGKHWRDHRSIHQNIIPATTGACKALGKIIPQVKDKMSGLAFRVPIVNVSVLDITIRLKANTTLQEIVKNIENASNTSMKNIIKISRDETVSSDYIGESHSCIFDSESSLQLKPNFYKLICWYENEHSYACRVIDSIFYSEQLLSLIRISSKMTYVRAKPSKKYDVVLQTECLSKEISVECKFNADLCSTSQDTGFKSKEPQVAALKKPLSAHIGGTAASSTGGRDTKRRNEIFKIWNDSNDISKSCVRQNRGSFFHSCISFTPQDIQSSNMKVTERLETVKRDVTKMTNITDDLLKTCNKKQGDADATFSVDNMNENSSTPLNISHEEPTKECAVKSHRKVASARIFDVSGDYQTKTEVADSKILGYSKEKLIRTHDSYNKEMSDYSLVPRKEPSMPDSDTKSTTTKPHNSLQMSTVQELPKFKSDIHTIQTAQDASKTLSDDNVFKEQVVKAITTLIDGLEQSFHVSCQSNNENPGKNGTIQETVKKELKENCNEDKIDMVSKKTNDFINKDNVIQNVEIENKFLQENLNIDYKIAHRFKRDKYKFNTATETKYKIVQSNKKLNKKQIVCSPVIPQLTTETDKDDKYFAKQILEGLNRVSPDPVVMIREDKTPSSSPDRVNSRKTLTVNVPKQDIFDKLESVSETDSDNSFEIHGRKSQVIHITDLTKSLEDLAKLDKICRIIEISDELSDKLFSALNTGGSRQKKWSFKDLCERIKLDEFCNKVFGKTAL